MGVGRPKGETKKQEDVYPIDWLFKNEILGSID